MTPACDVVTWLLSEEALWARASASSHTGQQDSTTAGPVAPLHPCLGILQAGRFSYIVIGTERKQYSRRQGRKGSPAKYLMARHSCQGRIIFRALSYEDGAWGLVGLHPTHWYGGKDLLAAPGKAGLLP